MDTVSSDLRLAPGLLLASPSLGDPNFERTVVLLGHHDQAGALGWVINGRGLMPVAELLRSSDLIPAGMRLPTWPSLTEPARLGGPVDPATGWLLYRSSVYTSENEMPIGTDMCVTGDSETLLSVVRGKGPAEFRLMIGYSGWGPGQLENEMRAGAWLPAPVDASLVFNTASDTIWEEAYRRSLGTGPAAFATGRRGQA